ncbi:hypothetical protein BH09MYX1_BH09MYX1_17760 [soil metagenome]
MARVRMLCTSLLALVGVFAAHPAIACGVGGVGGAGICDASEALDAKATAAAQSRDRFGFAYGLTQTALFFGDGRRADTTRGTSLLTWEHSFAHTWTLQVGLGVLLGGTIDTAFAHAIFRPGFLAAATLTHRIFEPANGARDGRPFILTSYTLSFATTTSKAGASDSIGYTALDFRFGLIVGTTFAGMITPYAALRIFGGPAFWRWTDGTGATNGVVGTDAYKYEAGGGVVVSLGVRDGSHGGRVGFFIDGSFVGERNVRAGASISF